MLCQSLRNSSKSPAKSSIADSRIQKDLHELATHRWTANCSVRITFPSTPNAGSAAATTGQLASQHFHVLITPISGAYAQSSFLFSIHIPTSYPFSPPHVRCLTPCLHPLLSFRTGRVYHPILHQDWKPVLTLNTIVFALQLLFHLHDSHQLTEGDEEVRRLMDGGGLGGGGLFDVLVQQTLDGGHYFGMVWARNREKTLAEEEQQMALSALQAEMEERKEYSPQQRSRQRPKRDGLGGMDEADEADEEANKRRRKSDEVHSATDDQREADQSERAEEAADEHDTHHRKHKQPHRHFLHRHTAISPPPQLRHTAHRTRRGQREEKEWDGGEEDARMTRADSFSFRALQSSLPAPQSPQLLPHTVNITSAPLSSSSSTSLLSSSAAPSIYSLSFPTSSARLFALSSSSSSSSPVMGSLAAMQRQHAMRTTLGATRAQPSAVRAAAISEVGSEGSAVNSVVRTLSSVMTD